MKYLIIGDLHGQYEIVDKAASKAEENNYGLVFVGDYLDSFNRTVEDQIRTLTTVLDLIESKKAIGLFGNHEMSYLDERKRCSGYNAATQAHIIHLESRMNDALISYIELEGFLITHAGVSDTFLKGWGASLEDYLAKGAYDQVGAARGGWPGRAIGGLRWCDFNSEFTPIEGVKQVFGHTRGPLIREVDGNYCIDCLEDAEPQGLLIEDGKASVFKL